MRVNITDARKNFSELIRAAERGGIVTICRREVPVADLRATTAARKRPKLGTLRGKIKIFDPNWWKPMTTTKSKTFSRDAIELGALRIE